MFADNARPEHVDKKIDANLTGEKFANLRFLRLVAKDKRFVKVDFRYATFDACYLRDCHFDSCDFTGCRFTDTNFHGSSFTGCKFDYATFEKTFIESEILDHGCPAHENLKMRFARSLRMNYQQLGDAKAANKAIGVELAATGEHLHKSWNSNEAYYRKKYSGFKRFTAFSEWASFKTMDFIWGNGESTPKLLRAVLIWLLFVALIDVINHHDPMQVGDYGRAIVKSPQLLLGTVTPSDYSSGWLTVIVISRLIAFGFFMAIIVKRFNRR